MADGAFSPLGGGTPTPSSPAAGAEPLLLPMPAPEGVALPEPPRGATREARAIYRDEDGRTLGCVDRIDLPDGGKTYRPTIWTPDGWVRKQWSPGHRPLYHLDRLSQSPDAPVLIVEGEKAARAVRALAIGHIPTTSPSGANAAAHADWSPMRGRRVAIWPDADPPGEKYAADVARCCHAAGAVSVAIVALPAGLPEGWDLADEWPEGWTLDTVAQMIRDAPRVDAPPPVAPIAPLGWPAFNLSILSDGPGDAPGVPVAALGPFGSYARDAAAAAGVSVDWPAWAALAAAAGCIGTAYAVRAGATWAEPIALWVVLIGPPGSGKSPTVAPLRGALAAIEADERNAMAPDLAAHAAAIEAAKTHLRQWETEVADAVAAGRPPPPKPPACDVGPAPDPRLTVADTTPERLGTLLATNPRGLIASVDELASVIEAFSRQGGGAGRPFLLSAYSGESYRVDRMSRDPLYLSRPLISLIATTQPDRWAALLADSGDGLCQRMVPVVGGAGRLPDLDAVVDTAGLRRILEGLRRLPVDRAEDGTITPRVLTLDDQARDRFDSWRQRHHTAQQADADAPAAEALAKLPGLVLRVAGVLALSRSVADHRPPPETIAGNVMADALALADHAAGHMRAAWCPGGRDGSPAARLARWLIRNRPSVITRREVQGRSRWARGKGGTQALNEALGALVDAGWLRAHPPPPGQPHPTRYDVTPHLPPAPGE